MSTFSKSFGAPKQSRMLIFFYEKIRFMQVGLYTNLKNRKGRAARKKLVLKQALILHMS